MHPQALAIFNAVIGNVLGVVVTPPLLLLLLGASSQISIADAMVKLTKKCAMHAACTPHARRMHTACTPHARCMWMAGLAARCAAQPVRHQWSPALCGGAPPVISCDLL